MQREYLRILKITQTRKSRERKVSRLRKLSGEKFGKKFVYEKQFRKITQKRKCSSAKSILR